MCDNNEAVNGMIFGDPYKFAILVEKVPAWNVHGGYIQGLFHFIIDGKLFPDNITTATLDSVVAVYFNEENALFNPPEDKLIFSMPKEEAFPKMVNAMRPDFLNPDVDIPDDFEENYRYKASTYNIDDEGFYVCAVAYGNKVRILGTKTHYLTGNIEDGREWMNCETLDIYEACLAKKEVLKIVKAVKASVASMIEERA